MSMMRGASRLALSASGVRSSRLVASRLMSTKVIAHVCGPDRVGILTNVSRIIAENGGKMHESRATALGGTFSMMAEVEVETDSAALGFALQSSLPDFISCIRPEGETEAEAAVFARLDLKKFPALTAISQITENLASRGIGIATLRTSEHSEDGGYYSATATLSSATEVDYKWMESEFAELSHKLNIDLEFKKLNPKTN